MQITFHCYILQPIPEIDCNYNSYLYYAEQKITLDNYWLPSVSFWIPIHDPVPIRWRLTDTILEFHR